MKLIATSIIGFATFLAASFGAALTDAFPTTDTPVEVTHKPYHAKVQPLLANQVPGRMAYGCFDFQQGQVGIEDPPLPTMPAVQEQGVKVYDYPVGAKIERMVYEAIKRGYRVFNGAQAYGNDRAIRRGVERAIEDRIINVSLWN